MAAERLPQARVVGDRFPGQQHLTEAVAATRRAVQPRLSTTDQAVVRRGRDVLVRNEADLAAAEWISLEGIKTSIAALGSVHTLKEEFRALCNAPLDRATAVEQLGAWLERAWSSGVAALGKCADFVDRGRAPILNYFVRRTTSGPVEGLNNKIKLILRQAFGFGTQEHFRLRVLMACDGTD